MSLSFRIPGFLIAFIFLAGTSIEAQDIPLGVWRTHLSFQSAKGVSLAGNRVYCVSDNGLFYFDRDDNSLQTLSRKDGLSEAIAERVAYDPSTQMTVIVYQNSNIDLLTSDEIIELPLIKNATLTGSKRINHIAFFQGRAYLSADFGVVVIDLQRKEIRETYRNIGIGGTNVAVFASAISNDSLFLASTQGVMRASLGDNLQDFNNWRTFTMANGIPAQVIKGVASRGNTVYASIDNLGLFKYNHSGRWSTLPLTGVNEFSQINSTQNSILISSPGRITELDLNDNVLVRSHPLIVHPREALIDGENKLWIADNVNGLLSNLNGNFENLNPNGPARSESWSLSLAEGKIVAVSGGYNQSNYVPAGLRSGYYVFENGQWLSYNNLGTAGSVNIPDMTDLLDAVLMPQSKDLFLASFGRGILVQRANGNFEVINRSTAGSPLEADINNQVRISGLAAGKEGELWVSNHSVATGRPSLHVLKSDRTWTSYFPINSAMQNPLDILIDNNNLKWIRLSPNRGGGLWVLDDRNNRSRYLSNLTNNGSFPNPNVNALAQDLDGAIWIGTDEGVTVIFNPANAANPQAAVNAITPIFENRPLLRFERVTAIAVDGGNRKWLGTDNGLWLFSPEGTRQILNFTEKNSPLLSDIIRDIVIHPQSGEVFIATDKGLVSYRSAATSADENFQKVKVFPNPVRPDFEGLVGISGLAANVNVKITDVSGRLMFETRSEGGTASWNLRDYSGNQARAGIYLIFCTNDEGTETLVAKLAVVR